MEISEKELKEIILGVLNGLGFTQKTDTVISSDVTYGTVAIIPSYLPKRSTAAKALQNLSDGALEIYTLNNTAFECGGCTVKTINTDAEKNALMDRLAVAETVILVSPAIKTLRNIADGQDEGIIECAVLKSILWGRTVKILIDFEPPKFKRGSFFETIVTTIDAISAMGVRISSYLVAKNGSEEKRSLVTETDILDAYNAAERMVKASAGAIITPLARDKAKELNVIIQQD